MIVVACVVSWVGSLGDEAWEEVLVEHGHFGAGGLFDAGDGVGEGRRGEHRAEADEAEHGDDKLRAGDAINGVPEIIQKWKQLKTC